MFITQMYRNFIISYFYRRFFIQWMFIIKRDENSIISNKYQEMCIQELHIIETYHNSSISSIYQWICFLWLWITSTSCNSIHASNTQQFNISITHNNNTILFQIKAPFSINFSTPTSAPIPEKDWLFLCWYLTSNT